MHTQSKYSAITGYLLCLFPATLLFMVFICTLSAAQPNFDLVGFATLNGGTTGGKAGQTVTASSYSQLKSYAESSTPYIIMVDGTITNGSAGGQIRVKSNKSIIGVGTKGFLQGVGIDISSQNNVIIQNLKITLVGTSNPGGVNGGDCISISGTSKNIWVDHCEVYSEDPSVQKNKDLYDGLLDIKGQTGFITLSWNYFHDHHKGSLVGAADNDLYNDRLVTIHHNHYKKVLLRVPMYRGATGHFFNNYISGATDATEIRAGTCVRVERNYYEALHYSIYTPTDAPGKAERISNIEVSRTSRAYPGNCTANIPYTYSQVLTSNTEDVKTIVPQYAGTGKIGTPVVKHSLTTSVQGQGTVSPASGSFNSGTNVTITATPANGYLFDRWSGDLSGTTNPATVNMNANKSIIAHFIQDTRKFYTITKLAAPGGSISQQPEGSSLVEGTTVTLTAVPEKGWTFNGWSGGHTGTVAAWTISSLNSNISVSASFLPTDKFVYQAENGILKEAVTETKNTGFTGESYVNFNAAAASVEIPVCADEAGTKAILITFSNGSGTARALSISVNNTPQIASVTFDATADWTTWESKQVVLSLPQGASTIILATINSQDGPNIDKISFDQATVTQAHQAKNAESVLSFNPAKRALFILNAELKNLKVNIFTLNGKKVFCTRVTTDIGTGRLEIPLTDVNSGVYLIRLECDGLVKTEYIKLL